MPAAAGRQALPVGAAVVAEVQGLFLRETMAAVQRRVRRLLAAALAVREKRPWEAVPRARLGPVVAGHTPSLQPFKRTAALAALAQLL
jgi:hypothetical protein